MVGTPLDLIKQVSLFALAGALVLGCGGEDTDTNNNDDASGSSDDGSDSDDSNDSGDKDSGDNDSGDKDSGDKDSGDKDSGDKDEKVDSYGVPSNVDEKFETAYSGEPVGLNCADPYEKWKNSGAARIKKGDIELFVAFQQTGSNNQDPMFRRFDNGKEKYCEHHETKGPDGRAYGLTWDGGDKAYVVYSIVGGGTEFDKLAKGHWLDRYGDGGRSSKVSVVSAVEVKFGTVVDATFVVARLSSGKTNSLFPAGPPYVLENGDIEFHGHSAFGPLNPDHSPMCKPHVEYPNGYRIRFSPDLKTARCADTLPQDDGSTCSMITTPCE